MPQHFVSHAGLQDISAHLSIPSVGPSLPLQVTAKLKSFLLPLVPISGRQFSRAFFCLVTVGGSYSHGHENLVMSLTTTKLRERHWCVSNDDVLALYEASKHKLMKIVSQGHLWHSPEKFQFSVSAMRFRQEYSSKIPG